jgi:hypothetical protein
MHPEKPPAKRGKEAAQETAADRANPKKKCGKATLPHTSQSENSTLYA